ncbi:MAG: glycosyl transferase [Bacteroidetes bacterium]|nr:MAG: glycosyl transferase [Bacteroidota bacterium]
MTHFAPSERFPLVSVIMPCYNAERFIAQAIESVVAQTYQEWELLVSDDCSTDGSVPLVKSYAAADGRIRLVKASTNGGAAMARNAAIRVAKGRFLAFLDSDDLWHPEKLERQIAFMLGHQHAFTYTSYAIVDEQGERCGTSVQPPPSLSYSEYLRNTAIGCLTVVVDRNQLGDVTMQSQPMHEDFATWLQLLKRIDRAYGLREELAFYRVVADSLSHNKLKAAKQVWRIYREVEGLGLLRSLYSFWGYAIHAVMKRL